MKNRLTQDQASHIRDLWEAIKWRMNVHRVTPEELARRTPYSQDLIERGIHGDPVPLTCAFRLACVKAFGLRDARGSLYGLDEDLSDDEIDRLLKPEPAMPPRQGNFWEWKD